jgi:hypothetical protein
MARQEHSILHKTEQGLIKCSFYMAGKSGAIPLRTKVDATQALRFADSVGRIVYEERQRTLLELPVKPVKKELVDEATALLSGLGKINPRGSIFLLKRDVCDIQSGLRLMHARRGPGGMMSDLAHGIAHLCGIGSIEDISVLLDKTQTKILALRMVKAAWGHTDDVPAYFSYDGWKWSGENSPFYGWFFMEAMSELVELHAMAVQQDGEAIPVTFMGRELPFRMPPAGSYCMIGRSILELDILCPGVAATLLTGMYGVADRERLESMIDAEFSGLYDELDRLQSSDDLHSGARMIADRL